MGLHDGCKTEVRLAVANIKAARAGKYHDQPIAATVADWHGPPAAF